MSAEAKAKIIVIGLQIFFGAVLGWAAGTFIMKAHDLFKRFRGKKFQVGDFIVEKPDPKLGPLPEDQLNVIMRVTGIGKSNYRTTYCIIAGQRLISEEGRQNDWPLWYVNDNFQKTFVSVPLKAVKND